MVRHCGGALGDWADLNLCDLVVDVEASLVFLSCGVVIGLQGWVSSLIKQIDRIHALPH